MADPWTKRLKWIAVIGLSVVWLVTLLMAWNGGAASNLLSENKTDVERLIEAWERISPRIAAEREALKRCKMVSEDCG